MFKFDAIAVCCLSLLFVIFFIACLCVIGVAMEEGSGPYSGRTGRGIFANLLSIWGWVVSSMSSRRMPESYSCLTWTFVLLVKVF